MLSTITDNIGTIIVGAVLAIIVILIIRKLYKDKKAGRSSCGCGCENCPSKGACHKQK